MTTGERIREARLRAGLTQKELADKVGVKFSAIHKYETGMIVNLKRETIAALAEALDVKPSWLMGFDNTRPSLADQFDINMFSRQLSPEEQALEDDLADIRKVLIKMPPETRKSLLTFLKNSLPQESAPDSPEEVQ